MRRVEALRKLGGKCALCGEFDLRLLDIEHIEERTGEKTAVAITRVLNGDTTNLQILCVACHRIKTIQGLEVAKAFGRIRRRFVLLCRDILRLERP